jgi:hypothetical protein
VTGPIVIVGRPRSGSRVLTRLLQQNGLFMGADLHPESLDSTSWHHRFVAPLMTSRFFPAWESGPPELWSLCRQCLDDTWPRYAGGQALPETWGWKVCETLFVIPIVKKLFPQARFIHIIRDARDVCLSNRGFFQLTQGSPPRDWYPAGRCGGYPSFREFCIAATFGRTGVREWRDLDLSSPAALVDNRYLVQAQSWVTCVTKSRMYGEALAEDYYEIRYEDLCRDPTATAQELFGWLNLPLRHVPEVQTGRVHKWRRARLTMRERRDFDNALALAAPVLKIFGYAH